MPNDEINLLTFFPITQNSQFGAEVYRRSQEIKIRKLNQEKNKYEADKTLGRK